MKEDLSVRVGANITGLNSAFRKAGRSVSGFAAQAGTDINTIKNKVFSLQTAITAMIGAFALKKLSEGFIETGKTMDMLQLSLETITKGRGAEWFEKLNEWALKMPVNTEKAVSAFTMLRAMGLKPTIDQMTLLVDTTSALGGSSDTMEGIARAFGQIYTKGKVMMQEVYQLAERGVPVFEIFREELGLTNEQISEIGTTGIDAATAIDAMWRGLAKRFGGQSKLIQDRWVGLTETMKSYWKEFQSLVMQ